MARAPIKYAFLKPLLNCIGCTCNRVCFQALHFWHCVSPLSNSISMGKFFLSVVVIADHYFVYILQEGCVMCRTETPVANFSDLKPGDHIVMRGQICCLGRAYDHHAIVTRVEPLGDHAVSANIHVVDVACKGLEFVGCMSQEIGRAHV